MDLFKSKTMKLICSMVLCATTGLLGSLIVLSPSAETFTVFIIGLISLVVYKAVKKEKLDLKSAFKDKYLLLAALFMGLSWVCLYEAYNTGMNFTTNVLYYLYPVPVLISGILHMKPEDIFRPRKIILIFVCLIAILGVSGAMENGFDFNLKGVIFALIAAACEAAMIILNRYKTKTETDEKEFVHLLIVALTMLVYGLVKKDFVFTGMDATSVVLLIVTGVLVIGLGLNFFLNAVSKIDPQTTAIICYMEPAVASFLACFFMGDELTYLRLMTSGIMLVSAACGELQFHED